MPFTPRPANASDLQTICAFLQSEEELYFFFPKAVFPLTPLQLQAAIEQRSDSTVVERKGRVVAFANFYRWEAGGRCCIGNVVVCPNARGQGVASYLVEQMVSRAFSKHQAVEVGVSCFHQNLAGLLLYHKLGFQPCSVEERKDRHGKPVVLVHMRLARNVG